MEEQHRIVQHLSVSRMKIRAGRDVSFAIEGEVLPGRRHGKQMLHDHAHYELVFVEDGELIQHLETGHFHYHKGDACFLNRNTRHLEGFESDCDLVFVNLPPEFLHALLDMQDLSLRKPQYRERILAEFIRDNEHAGGAEYIDFAATMQDGDRACWMISQILHRIMEELAAARVGYGYRAMALLLELFSVLEDPEYYHAARIRLDSDPEEFVYLRVRRYLEERHGRFSREELARVMHYSPDHLNLIVKRHSGLTLTGLGQSITMEEARQLMLRTDMSISQIMQQLNYTNRSHFYQLFEKETGMKPGAWRQAQQHKEVKSC